MSEQQPKQQTLFDMARYVYDIGYKTAQEGKYDDAIGILENVNSLLPMVTVTMLQAGRCHWEMHRWDAAKRYFDIAARLEPENNDTAWTVGLLALQTGDFLNGWKGYERRWGSKAFKSPKLYTKHPQWVRFSHMKRPVVWCEQGIGDQLLYASLIQALAEECTHVTVLIDSRLAGLLQRGCKAENVTFLSHNARIKMSEHDSHIPIASLGKYFIREVWDIPLHRSEIYLKADLDYVKYWRRHLGLKDERVIGLSWVSTAPVIGPHKSVGLEGMRTLFDLPNTKFINLQYGDSRKDAEGFHPNLITPDVEAFFDLENMAALMDLCDVIVSPSNANVHLAGALGKPVMLLDANKLWYWNNRKGYESLWYPSVKVFQRENMNAPWDLQVSQVKHELEILFGLRERKASHFAFFHVGQDISYPQKMVKSLLRHNPDATVYMFTDYSTPDVMGVAARYVVDVDKDNLMYSRMKAYSQWNSDVPVMYLDTDMIIQDKIVVEDLLSGKDAAFLQRSFNSDAEFNIEQRGMQFEDYKGKTLGELYPYVGCTVVVKDNNVWMDLLKIYDELDPKFKKWYGDQEALRIFFERHSERVALMVEAEYGCLPEYVHEGAKILHYKGENRKKLFEVA